MPNNELHYVPVFEIDPNNPGRDINGVLCIYTGISSSDMLEDFRDGTHKRGDLAFAYQPNEEYDEVTKKFGPDSCNDSGIGFPCRIVDWHEVRHPQAGSLKMLVYLEIDTAYAILDRRRAGSNDEGNDDGNDRARQGRVSGLEESAGESGRPDGTSVAM